MLPTTSKPNLYYRFQRLITVTWYRLYTPLITGLLLAILLVVVVLRLIIPQQTSFDTAVTTWITSLPPLIQPSGDLLFSLGFSRIFQSGWFWIPLALLLLNSLLALAEYGLPSWRRAKTANAFTSIEWQHPLAQRAEHSVRLPKSPDVFLDKLKEKLEAKGFSNGAPDEENQRVISAERWRWSWLSVVILYGGVILLCVAFLISHYSLQTERLTLVPGELKTSQLFGGSLELSDVNDANDSGLFIFMSRDNQQAAQTLRWRLYLPVFYSDLLILPISIEPLLSIEARDSAGDLRRLLPLDEALSPATRLNLPLDQPDTPFIFLMPSGSLAFQILPVSTPDEDRYNVQVRRGSESSPSENLMVGLGETFEVDGFSVTISPSHNMTFIARRDLALPLYFISITAVVVGGLLLLFRRPWQVWLIPEVKGIGGQLYGVVERLGSVRGASEFLEELLTEEGE